MRKLGRFGRNVISNAGGNAIHGGLQLALLLVLFQLLDDTACAAFITATYLIGVLEMASDFGGRLWATREFSLSQTPRLVLSQSLRCKLFIYSSVGRCPVFASAQYVDDQWVSPQCPGRGHSAEHRSVFVVSARPRTPRCGGHGRADVADRDGDRHDAGGLDGQQPDRAAADLADMQYSEDAGRVPTGRRAAAVRRQSSERRALVEDDG